MKKSCPFCSPDETTKQFENIPCSEYHVRCIKCGFPVAKTHAREDGLCQSCLPRRRGERTLQ